MPARRAAEFGPPQDVDTIGPEEWFSHRLSSSRVDVPNANYHGAVDVDQHLPLDGEGAPLYAPAWDYLLGIALFTDSFGQE